MRHLGKLIIAALISGAPFGAFAADEITLPVSSDKSIPVTGGEFDWNGFYAGVYGVTQSSGAGGVQYGLGLNIGADARLQMVLVGGEIDLQQVTGGAGPTTQVQALGKAGVALTDDVVLYAMGGIGTDVGSVSATDALLGGGLQLAVTSNVSVEARYMHGFALSGANPKDQLTLGANFHF
jgi:outer membrane immunogenic protein